MSSKARAVTILAVCVVVAAVMLLRSPNRSRRRGIPIPSGAEFTVPDPEPVSGTKLLTLPGRRIVSLDYDDSVGLLVLSRRAKDDPPDSRLEVYSKEEDGFSLEHELSLAGRAYRARFVHEGEAVLLAANRYPIADPNAADEQAQPHLDDVLLHVELASGATTLLSQRGGRFSLSPNRKRIALVTAPFDTDHKLRWPSQLVVGSIGDLADHHWNCANIPLGASDFILRAPIWSTLGERLVFEVDTAPDPLVLRVTSAAAARDAWDRLPWETLKRRIVGKTNERAFVEGVIASAHSVEDQATRGAQYEASLRIAAPLRLSDAAREILESAANIDSVAEDLEEMLREAEADPEANDPPLEYVVSKPLYAPHHPMFSRAGFSPIGLDGESNELLYFADIKSSFLASHVAGIYAMTLEDGKSRLVFGYPETGIEAPSIDRYNLLASPNLRWIAMVMYQRKLRSKLETRHLQVFDRVTERLFTLDLPLDMYTSLRTRWLSDRELFVSDAAGNLWRYQFPPTQ